MVGTGSHRSKIFLAVITHGDLEPDRLIERGIANGKVELQWSALQFVGVMSLNVSMLMRRYRAMSTLLAPIPAICLTLARSSSVGSWAGRPLPRFSSTNMAKWGIIAYADFQNGFEILDRRKALRLFGVRMVRTSI